jgi:ubiquinone/menaquinone biosynthesis C-methylase UbiE
MNETVYGNYSTGSGTGIEDDNTDDVLSSSSILYYEKEISNNLYKMGLDIKSLAGMNVLNIGSGREAIALSNLGAKMVSHFDYSRENVERLKLYIKNSNIKSIKTYQADIVNYPLKHSQFDLIYTHGVVQHFSDTGMGLLNLLKSLKKDGLIWLYFYRSGSFSHFINSMIRDIGLEKAKMKDYYIALSLLESDEGTPNQYVSDFMDRAFCEYANLFEANKYIDFVSQYGFKVVSSSKLDPINRQVDHKYSHQSTILVAQLENPGKLYKNLDSKILSHNLSVNQLDKELYQEQPRGIEVIEILHEYEKLKKVLLEINSEMINFSFAYSIFNIYMKGYYEYCKNGYYDLDVLYPSLEKCIKNLHDHIT